MVKRRFEYSILSDIVSRNTTVMGVMRELGVPITGSWQAYISKTIKSLGIPWPHYLGCSSGLGGPKKVYSSDILIYDRLNGRREYAYKLRQAILEKGVPHCCSVCKLGSMWEGKPLVLQIDHIDGNYLNNLIENVRFLCPNCHTQTPNYAGNKGCRNFTPQVQEPCETIFTCSHCNRQFTSERKHKQPKYCSQKCSQESREVVSWPSDEELSKLVWSKSVLRLAQEWNISDNAIRHRCKCRGIPTPPRGYWVKHQDVA